MITDIPFAFNPGDILKGLSIAWNLIKSIFTPPEEDDESPQDVAHRSEQIRAFCDHINDQARQVEDAAVQQLRDYAHYLTELSQDEMLTRYQIHTENFIRQIDMLCMQLPGVIASEVSKRLNESDPEFHKIQWMLPGAEKEAAMQTFTSQTIREAVEKCATLSEQIMETIQTNFIALLEEAVDQNQRQLEKKEQALAELEAAAGNAAEQENIRCQAELVCVCCQYVEEAFCEAKEAD